MREEGRGEGGSGSRESLNATGSGDGSGGGCVNSVVLFLLKLRGDAPDSAALCCVVFCSRADGRGGGGRGTASTHVCLYGGLIYGS